MMNKKLIAVTAASALLAACAGLPGKPVPPKLSNEVPMAGADTPANGKWPDAKWWKRYNDPQLDALIEQALQGSPSLTAAQTRFDSAVQTVRANLTPAHWGRAKEVLRAETGADDAGTTG